MATSRSDQSAFPPTSPAAPAEHGLLAVQGQQLYWERHGDPGDPCILLLHHGLGSVRSWRRQIPELAAAGWQVLAYDRWGYGRSDERPAFEPGFLLGDAEQAFELLDALGVGKLALLGHSDGGTIALLMAALQPQRIQRLVVVAAHVYYEARMRAGLEAIAAYAQDAGMLAGLRREHGQRAPGLLRAWVDHWRAPEVQSLDMRDQLASIICPTLVIQGEQDEHATHQHAADIAEGVQQGSLWLIPGVKHMPTHEVPEEFNQRVLAFLEAVRR